MGKSSKFHGEIPTLKVNSVNFDAKTRQFWFSNPIPRLEIIENHRNPASFMVNSPDLRVILGGALWPGRRDAVMAVGWEAGKRCLRCPRGVAAAPRPAARAWSFWEAMALRPRRPRRYMGYIYMG
jgi:hypothetical protein